MIAAVQLKRHVASARIIGVVIREIDHWQEPGLIILFEWDKDLKISLYSAVSLFRLVISLGVESNRKSLLDFEEIIKQKPKFWDKQQASIRHNRVEEAIVPDYYFEDDFC